MSENVKAPHARECLEVLLALEEQGWEPRVGRWVVETMGWKDAHRAIVKALTNNPYL